MELSRAWIPCETRYAPSIPRDFSAALAHNKRNNSISCGEGTISDAVRRGRLKQRETIVSGNASGRAVSKRRSEFCGGAATVLKEALQVVVGMLRASRIIPLL